VELGSFDFSPFGSVHRLKCGQNGVVSSAGDGWSGVFTSRPLNGRPGSLGLTYGSPAPCVVKTMERHHHTREALFGCSVPIVLAVADTKGDAPDAKDIRAVVLREGDLVILGEGIWHDACHGLGVPAGYYWYAECDPNIKDPWVAVSGGPVSLLI
jgi:ureidoglycolate lyase